MSWGSPLDIIEMDATIHETDVAVFCGGMDHNSEDETFVAAVDMNPDVAVERLVRSIWGDVVWAAIEHRRSNYGR